MRLVSLHHLEIKIRQIAILTLVLPHKAGSKWLLCVLRLVAKQRRTVYATIAQRSPRSIVFLSVYRHSDAIELQHHLVIVVRCHAHCTRDCRVIEERMALVTRHHKAFVHLHTLYLNGVMVVVVEDVLVGVYIVAKGVYGKRTEEDGHQVRQHKRPLFVILRDAATIIYALEVRLEATIDDYFYKPMILNEEQHSHHRQQHDE